MKIFKKTALCICSCLLLWGGVACQPTPEQPVVVQRSALEEKNAETPENAPPKDTYDAPEHWTDTIERGNVTVSVDTDVILPDVTQYPVTILEPMMFSHKRVDELVNYFAGDNKLFCYPSIFTKADYQEMLIRARRGQVIDGEYVVNEATERYAESIEEKIADATEDSVRVYTDDTTFTYNTDLEGNVEYEAGPNYLSVGVEFEDGNEATIIAQNFIEGYGNSTRFSFRRIGGYTKETFYQEYLTYGDESEYGFDGYGKIFESIDLDIDAAKAQALRIISDLGIEDMALVNEEKAVFKSMGNKYGVSNNQPSRGGYVFEYVRSSGGISGFQLTSFSSRQPSDYSPPYFQEMLTICVSKSGIVEFSWSSLAQVVEIVSENVTLLPFKDIRQALVDQIYYERVPIVEENNASDAVEVFGEMAITVNVLSAELRVGYIRVKDNTRQAMLVPMWVFETSEMHEFGDEKGDAFRGKTYQFNAIDGGTITPSRGAVAP